MDRDEMYTLALYAYQGGQIGTPWPEVIRAMAVDLTVGRGDVALPFDQQTAEVYLASDQPDLKNILALIAAAPEIVPLAITYAKGIDPNTFYIL